MSASGAILFLPGRYFGKVFENLVPTEAEEKMETAGLSPPGVLPGDLLRRATLEAPALTPQLQHTTAAQ